jgi:hypothetical protein
LPSQGFAKCAFLHWTNNSCQLPGESFLRHGILNGPSIGEGADHPVCHVHWVRRQHARWAVALPAIAPVRQPRCVPIRACCMDVLRVVALHQAPAAWWCGDGLRGGVAGPDLLPQLCLAGLLPSTGAQCSKMYLARGLPEVALARHCMLLIP